MNETSSFLLVLESVLASCLLTPLIFLLAWAFLIVAPVLILVTLPVLGLIAVLSRRLASRWPAAALVLRRRPRVLVVDDDASAVLPVLSILEGRGAEVDYAPSGTEMLQKLKRAAFDLIVLDSRMPDLNGEEALTVADERLESFGPAPATRVLFFTDNDQIRWPKSLRRFHILERIRKGDLHRMCLRLETHLAPVA